MANTKPPVRVSSEDNKIIRQQALPIKMGYYDKYPDAMRILESPVYGKNEIVLQALQFMYDCFPIEMVSRESAKALSTAMGFDKNGNRLEAKIRGRKRKINHKGQETGQCTIEKQVAALQLSGTLTCSLSLTMRIIPMLGRTNYAAG